MGKDGKEEERREGKDLGERTEKREGKIRRRKGKKRREEKRKLIALIINTFVL